MEGSIKDMPISGRPMASSFEGETVVYIPRPESGMEDGAP